MKLKEMLQWINPKSREDIMGKIAKVNDSVLFTDGLGPNEVDYMAKKNGRSEYGTIIRKKGKWELKKLD